jgi:hypothetical protein
MKSVLVFLAAGLAASAHAGGVVTILDTDEDDSDAAEQPIDCRGAAECAEAGEAPASDAQRIFMAIFAGQALAGEPGTGAAAGEASLAQGGRSGGCAQSTPGVGLCLLLLSGRLITHRSRWRRPRTKHRS